MIYITGKQFTAGNRKPIKTVSIHEQAIASRLSERRSTDTRFETGELYEVVNITRIENSKVQYTFKKVSTAEQFTLVFDNTRAADDHIASVANAQEDIRAIRRASEAAMNSD